MKYTVQIHVMKFKTKSGYVRLPGWVHMHVEASSEEEARQKALQRIDPKLEPVERESMVL